MNCPLGFEGDGKICTPSTRSNLECIDNSICNENARCVQYPSSPPICVCKPGFTGNGLGDNGCVALAAYDPCVDYLCLHNGTCVKNGTTPYCQCPSNTFGERCEIQFDPCTPNPCQNNGTCAVKKLSNDFHCFCQENFQGSICEDQIEDCVAIIEKDNGTLRYPSNSSTTYKHNVGCAWTIRTDLNKVLKLTFKMFKLELSVDCYYDFLQVIRSFCDFFQNFKFYYL